MNKKTLIALSLAAASMLSACVVAPGPGYREPVYVDPPPPRVEYPGYPPVVGYIWFGGFWTWTGHRHEWVPGHWDAPRPGYRWVVPRWEREGNHWRQHEGRWDHDDRGPRGNPLPPPPRYEAPRPEPMPQYRQEHGYQAPPQQAPAPVPRHDMGNLPPAREMGRDAGREREYRGQPEMRSAPPQQQHGPDIRREDRDRGERGDGRGRRNRDDDR